MGQAGSSIACTYISESEQDYLLQIHNKHQRFERGKFGRFLAEQQSPFLLHFGEEFEYEYEEEEDMTLFVPDECLEWVFNRLSPGDRTRCSLVCRRWHQIEGQSRTELSLSAHADLTVYIPRICFRYVQLTKLTLRCDRRDASVGDRALILLAKHCRSLVKLKLKGLRDVSDEGLDQFSRLNRTLKKFSCGACGFGPLGLNSLLQRSECLESLTVKRLRGLSQVYPEVISPGSSKIRKLCLKEIRNARLFGPLIVGSVNLKVLRLAKNLGHWDKLLEGITVHLEGLLELHVERLQISDRGLQAVAQCKSLEALYIVKASECTNFGLSAIAFGCRNLKRLRLDGWRSGRIGDEGLISIAKRCRDLQELVLIRLSITVGSLTVLGSNCASLERLAICNCDTFGDAELCCISSRFRSLKKLCIRSCPISDLGLESLGNGCPSLTRLKIRNCNQVTAEGMTSLKMRMPRNVWISLINDVVIGPLPTTVDEEIHPAVQVSSTRIQRVLQGSSQLMKTKFNWAASNTAVSCYCDK